MENLNRVKEILSFIETSVTQFHFVAKASSFLSENGFILLDETKPFNLEKGKSYYLVRNSSSLIAFRIPERFESFHIVSAHTDSPVLKIKGDPEVKGNNVPVRLNVESYGGLLLFPWFDRPLSIAGRVFVKSGASIKEVLVNLDPFRLVIPSVAIHQKRESNDGWKISVQKDMLPLFSQSDDASFISFVAEKLGILKDDIIDMELNLYPTTEAMVWGKDNEFISCARLDDLECATTALFSLITSECKSQIPVCALFDNEETGSGTKQGALSDFLFNTLKRVSLSLGINEEEFYMLLSSTRMLSADNGHAVHPALPEKSDITNRVELNNGILVKYSSNQKYTTDGESGAWIKNFMKNNDIKYQNFYNHSDYPGGSTLGNLSAQKVSVRTCDIGLAQLGMHSPYETAGSKDLKELEKLFTLFLSV